MCRGRGGARPAAAALCILVALLLLGIVGVAAWGSLIRFWPYNLSLTLDNYDFARFDTAGWGSGLDLGPDGLLRPRRSARAGLRRGLAAGTRAPRARGALLRPSGCFAAAPLAIPGLVLGLAYILFFNHPANPLV
jgi:iron(III) transport system permease protein